MANAWEREIIRGMRNKWCRNHADPRAERFHLIFWHPNDEVEDEKFAPLRRLDRQSKLYIIGHSAKGADSIYSDPIYLSEGETKPAKRGLTATYLAQLLYFCLRDSDAALWLDPTSPYLSQQRRRLKICVPACYSAAGKYDAGKRWQAPFIERLMYCLINDFSKVLCCDVQGALGIVVPMPGRAGSAIAHWLARDVTGAGASGFHKRHIVGMGIWPSHKPSRDYKRMVVLDTSRLLRKQLAGERTFSVKTLSERERYRRTDEQGLAEVACEMASLILAVERLSLSVRQQAGFLLHAIKTGALSCSDLERYHQRQLAVVLPSGEAKVEEEKPVSGPLAT
jgi:hypothetical protein